LARFGLGLGSFAALSDCHAETSRIVFIFARSYPMKIVEIIESKTDSKSILFRVDPPLTPEVFEIFQNRLVNTRFPERSIDSGNLRMAYDSGLAARSIQSLNEVLEAAEKEIRDTHEKAKQDRKKFLDTLSQNLGLAVK